MQTLGPNRNSLQIISGHVKNNLLKVNEYISEIKILTFSLRSVKTKNQNEGQCFRK